MVYYHQAMTPQKGTHEITFQVFEFEYKVNEFCFFPYSEVKTSGLASQKKIKRALLSVTV